MMKHRLAFGFLLVLFAPQAIADASIVQCAHLPPSQGLSLTQCDREGRVAIARFRNQSLSSPYATEFDNRNVVVGSAELDGGESELERSLRAKVTKLIGPPQIGAIAKREKRITKYGEWSILKEVVQYEMQGGAPGYVMQCMVATAKRRKQLTVVGECLPLEEEDRFLALVSSVLP